MTKLFLNPLTEMFCSLVHNSTIRIYIMHTLVYLCVCEPMYVCIRVHMIVYISTCSRMCVWYMRARLAIEHVDDATAGASSAIVGT